MRPSGLGPGRTPIENGLPVSVRIPREVGDPLGRRRPGQASEVSSFAYETGPSCGECPACCFQLYPPSGSRGPLPPDAASVFGCDCQRSSEWRYVSVKALGYLTCGVGVAVRTLCEQLYTFTKRGKGNKIQPAHGLGTSD